MKNKVYKFFSLFLLSFPMLASFEIIASEDERLENHKKGSAVHDQATKGGNEKELELQDNSGRKFPLIYTYTTNDDKTIKFYKISSFEPDPSINNPDVKSIYKKAIDFGFSAGALDERGKLKNIDCINIDTVCYLYDAYKWGHEKSKKILRNIVWAKLNKQGNNKNRWKHLFKEKSLEIKNFEDLPEEGQKEFNENWKKELKELFPHIRTHTKEKIKAFKPAVAQAENTHSSLKACIEETVFFRSTKGTEPEPEQIEAYERALIQVTLEAEKELQALLTARKKAHGGHFPTTKTALFERTVTQQLTAKLTGMVAVIQGEAERKPDLINNGIKYLATGVCIGAIFIPYGGSFVGMAANATGAVANKGYNTYRVHKDNVFLHTFLPEGREMATVCNIVAPQAARALTERYMHPIQLLKQKSSKEIKQLANKAVELMIVGSYVHPKHTDWSEDLNKFYDELSEFFCDSVSYFTKKAFLLSAPQKAIYQTKNHKVLTRSGVEISNDSSNQSHNYYVKSIKRNKKNQKADEKSYKRAFEYGFRLEMNKEDKTLRKLGYKPLGDERWIEEVKNNQIEVRDSVVPNEENAIHKKVLSMKDAAELALDVGQEVAPEGVKILVEAIKK